LFKKPNLRTELSKSRKIYFYDNGIRNALIGNFNSVEIRIDTGALWKIFLISERLKLLHNNEYWTQRFFWRTTEQQEIDYVKEKEGVLQAFEFKWNRTSKAKISKTFSKAYPNATTFVISPENFESFVTEKNIFAKF
jgi:predicted AAA+ superfamily ATPase